MWLTKPLKVKQPAFRLEASMYSLFRNILLVRSLLNVRLFYSSSVDLVNESYQTAKCKCKIKDVACLGWYVLANY